MKLFKLNNKTIKVVFGVLFFSAFVVNTFSQQVFEENFEEFVRSTQINAEETVILHKQEWKFAYVDCKYSNASLKQCVVLRHSGSGNNLKLGYIITPQMKAPQKLSFWARLQYSDTRDNSVDVQISEDGGPFTSVGSIVIKASVDRLNEPYRQYSIPINSISNNVRIKIQRRPSATEHSDINIIIDNFGVALGDPNKCKLDCNLPSHQDICEGGASVKLDASVSATGAISYRWSTGDTTSFIRASTPGLYTVVIKNSCGESITRQVLVRSLQDAGIYGKDGNLNQSASLCYGSSIQLNAGEGNAVSYQWSPADYLSNPNIANPIASPISSTTYNVAITTTGGCRINKAVYVNVNEPFELNTGRDSIYGCKGQRFTLDVSGADAYRWYPKDGLSCFDCSNPEYTISGNRTYTVTGIKNGCTASKAIQIAQRSDEIFFEYTKSGCSISFKITNVDNDYSYNYTWSFGDGATATGTTPEHTYAMHGTYNVCVGFVNSCEETVSRCIPIIIKAEECSCQPPSCSEKILLR
jgi:PKD repeat protein